MKKSQAARKRIAEVRRILETPNETKGRDMLMCSAVYALSTDVSRWARDPELAEEALDLWRTLAEHQGRGGKISAVSMSRLLRHLALELGQDLLERPERSEPELFELAETLPPADTGPQTEVARALLEEAARVVGGRRSRSRRMEGLRADFWSILLELHSLAPDPGLRDLALKIAGDPKTPCYERIGALEFLAAHSGEDPADGDFVALLGRVCDDPGEEGLLITALNAKIDLGLADEFDALVALDDWRDSPGMG